MSGLQMKYFVLKPKGADPFAVASRAAMRQYAKLIRDQDSELADALEKWATREQVAAMPGEGAQ